SFITRDSGFGCCAADTVGRQSTHLRVHVCVSSGTGGIRAGAHLGDRAPCGIAVPCAAFAARTPMYRTVWPTACAPTTMLGLRSSLAHAHGDPADVVPGIE